MDKKIVLVSHGKLALGMKNSLQMIIGENENILCYSLMPGEHYQYIVDDIEKHLINNPNTQYVVIGDLLGGSVCNGLSALVQYSNLKLITGMNMGLVIELLFSSAPITDDEIAQKIEVCKNGIVHISSEYLNKEDKDSFDDFF